MKREIAPEVFRQRLLIEGYWTCVIDQEVITKYLLELAQHLSMRTYAEPIVYAPRGDGKEENQGYDAFVPLIDSGISAYFWTKQRFFSIVIYTCKAFDEQAAIEFSQAFFKTETTPCFLSF